MAKKHIKLQSAFLALGATPTTFKVRSCTMSLSVETVDVTDTGSGGFQELLDGGGIGRGEVEFEAWIDMTALPHAVAHNVKPGEIEPFVMTIDTGKTWSGSLFFEEVEWDFGEVDGDAAYLLSVTAQITGAPTYPTTA